MKKIILLSFLILMQQNLSAQNSSVKIINATQQSWSGGIAGMHGERFYFDIETPANFSPDTFWLNGYSIPIEMFNPSDSTEEFNCKLQQKGNKNIYSFRINFNYPNTEYPMYSNESNLPEQKERNCMYELFLKNRKSICITKFQTLEPLSYP